MVLPEHEQRFQRIVTDYLARPGGDYAELLHRGRTSSPDGVDAEQWRRDIRRQARQDKIRVLPAATDRAHSRRFTRRCLTSSPMR